MESALPRNTVCIDIIIHFIELQELFDRHNKPDLSLLLLHAWFHLLMYDINMKRGYISRTFFCMVLSDVCLSLVCYLNVFTCSVSHDQFDFRAFVADNYSVS